MGLRFRHLASICLAILFLGYCYSPAKIVRAVTQNASGWIHFVPADEELTFSVPGNPIARIHPVYKPRDNSVERVLAHREYSGYGNGLIFIIQSFKADRPERLSNTILNLREQGTAVERDIFIDGVAAKETVRTVTSPRGTYTQHNVRFITGKHLYLVTLATLEVTSPATDQFLSSLRRRKDEKTTPIQPPAETDPGTVSNTTEVTRRAIVVWKNEPFYTEEAREHKTTGGVTLEAVFAENGYVTNIKVTRALAHGLTESAIEAARNIRFFPAEKDGKPVSQRTMLEYSFNLY